MVWCVVCGFSEWCVVCGVCGVWSINNIIALTCVDTFYGKQKEISLRAHFIEYCTTSEHVAATPAEETEKA